MENLRAKAREEALEAAKQLEEVQEKLAFNLLVAGEIWQVFISLNWTVHLPTITKLRQRPCSMAQRYC